jgi:hypothetical protein
MGAAPTRLLLSFESCNTAKMIEAGYSEKEAMEISGHKTRAVFDRYHIVSSKRMKEFSRKMATFAAVQDTMGRSNEVL